MCVIAYSPAGIPIPSQDDIEKMFKKNPHGAGMAITKPDGFTEWHKGYMDLESFNAKLDEFSPEMLKECETTLHFRITTKGNTDPETCHPFPVSPQFSDMRKLHGITQGPVVFHNGTITGFGGIGAQVASDSQDFVMGPMFYIMKGLKPDRNMGKLRKTAIEQLLGSSRLLIMMANGDNYRLGSNWTQHTDKCYYSNMLWRPSTPVVNNTYRNYTQTYSSSAVANTQTKNIPASTATVNPKEPDEWGCHNYAGAWPGEGKEWIEFKTADILEMAIRHMTTIIRDGETIYKHKESGMEYQRSGDLTLITEKGLELMSDFYIDTYGFAESEIEEMAKEGNISFNTINDLSEFLEVVQENKDGTYRYREDDWYADYDALALYTKDFLMAYFSDNIDEVIKSLLNVGYIEDKFLDDDGTDFIKINQEELNQMTAQDKADKVATKLKAQTT